MTKKYSYLTILLLLIFQLFLTPSIASSADNKLIGKKVVFVEKDSSSQEFGYMFIYNKPDISANFIPYKGYVGKKGTITEIVDDTVLFPFLKIKLESGESVYTKKPLEFDNRIEGMYFVDDYAEAKKKIGADIWINKNTWKQQLLTETRNKSYPLKHLGKVIVLNVITKVFEHAYGGAPFYLIVQKDTGEKGFIGYKADYYFDNDPILPFWDKHIIATIKNQKIRLGMTKVQVTLSWGHPKKVNRTVTRNGIREQWVYKKQYIYFENDQLTAIQD